MRPLLTIPIGLALGLLTGGRAAGDAVPAPGDGGAAEPRRIEFFEARIRPVLVKHCYECHSADAGEPKGGLLLDSRDRLRAGGDSGAPIVPGRPDDSLLVDAMRYDGLEMPPSGRLPENVVRDFEEWVRMGAPDPRAEVRGAPTSADAVQQAGIDLERGRRFWAFQPPRKHPLPPVLDESWPATWIDRFVLARLEEAGLRPSPDVDRPRLLRRLTYDLTGLPPTRAELESFLADDSDLAVERVVDRLLASPRFGEHWGRRWLDVARYADSNGSDFNATFHNAWRYRDYVIRAFNEDKPFDRFIREQIAGDLLPYDSDGQRAEQLVATGFLMVGAKMLSERDKGKLVMDVVDEQIDSVGRAFLGMTLGCARCHDHKFDPIPTEDYYALAGIFRSTQTLEGEIQQYVSNWVRQPLPIAPGHAEALARYDAETSELAARLKTAKEVLQRAETEAATAALLGVGVVVDDVDAERVGEWKHSTYSPRFVGEGYVHDDNQGKGEKSITFIPDLPRAGEYEVRLSYASGGGRAGNVPVHVRHAEGTGDLMLDQRPTPPIADLFQPIGRFRFESGRAGSVTISTSGTQGHVIADAAHFIPVESLEAAEAATGSARAAQAAVDEAAAAVQSLEEERKRLEAEAPPLAPLALAPREAAEIGDCRLCIRGEHDNLGPAVPRGFLQVALFDDPPEFPADESGRRELADWIADPRHPLTARVIVNRVWSQLLGEGLVRTVDNFGVLGEPPSHPELLDRLAVEFVESGGCRAPQAGGACECGGWSIKRLVREIVLSRTYRIDSRHDDDAFQADPENRLRWRAERRRLPAEAIRDAMLAVASRLDPVPGGSPVEGLGTLVTANRADDSGPTRQESSRRTIYEPVLRGELPPLLTVFDFADPDFVTGKRPVTTVPSQALFLMNSPFVREAAEAAAARMREEASLDELGRLEWAWQTLLARSPSEGEIPQALSFVHGLQAEGASDEAADRVQAGDEAWVRLIHALLACTEFRMVD